MKLLLGMVAAFLVLVALIRSVRSERLRKAQKIEAVFANRAPLSTEQFYERHFREQGVPLRVVQGVREILELYLAADLSRLADSDDFSKNLALFWDFDSLADVEIVNAIEERFQIKISDEEAVDTHTVRDLIELVWAKLKIAEGQCA